LRVRKELGAVSKSRRVTFLSGLIVKDDTIQRDSPIINASQR
jgi:hypothetical protein